MAIWLVQFSTFHCETSTVCEWTFLLENKKLKNRNFQNSVFFCILFGERGGIIFEMFLTEQHLDLSLL